MDQAGYGPGFVGFLNRVRDFWGLLTQQSASQGSRRFMIPILVFSRYRVKLSRERGQGHWALLATRQLNRLFGIHFQSAPSSRSRRRISCRNTNSKWTVWVIQVALFRDLRVKIATAVCIEFVSRFCEIGRRSSRCCKSPNVKVGLHSEINFRAS